MYDYSGPKRIFYAPKKVTCAKHRVFQDPAQSLREMVKFSQVHIA